MSTHDQLGSLDSGAIAPSNWRSRLRESRAGLFFRKCINTFRFTASLYGRLKGGAARRERDALIWTDERHYKTAFYKELDITGSALVEAVTSRARPSESVLDLCCNQGRFLLELKRRGYTDLRGFDIMEPAIKTLRSHPDFNEHMIHVEHCLAQDYLDRQPDASVDWAITHGATIELIHPEFDIFGELARVVRQGMLLALHENGHSYPRFYRYLHRANGFRLVSDGVLVDGFGLTLFLSLKA